MIELVPTEDLERISKEAAIGGEYEAVRSLVNHELQRRALAILALGAIDMPVADIEASND